MSIQSEGYSAKLIGVAVPSLNNSVSTEVLRGICDVATSSGYRVLIVDTHYSALEEERMVRTLLAQSLDALIITGGEQTEHCRKTLEAVKVPLVQMMEILDDPIDMNVGFSHWQAGYDVAQHLMEEGYSRIGFIGAQMDIRAQHRMHGFRTALEEKGKFWKNFMLNTPDPSSVALGVELFKELVSSANDMIEAVFCANDDLALGALFESVRMGIKVPDDMAICGFNDMEASRFTTPSLTSVSVNRYEMGVKSAELVLGRLMGKLDQPKVIDVGYEIKKRGSTGSH